MYFQNKVQKTGESGWNLRKMISWGWWRKGKSERQVGGMTVKEFFLIIGRNWKEWAEKMSEKSMNWGSSLGPYFCFCQSAHVLVGCLLDAGCFWDGIFVIFVDAEDDDDASSHFISLCVCTRWIVVFCKLLQKFSQDHDTIHHIGYVKKLIRFETLNWNRSTDAFSAINGTWYTAFFSKTVSCRLPQAKHFR